jgi:hypothetical protein
MGKLKLKLIPGREYLITHKRKRTFRAEFKRFVRAPATDTLDEVYFECEVDAALSGNPWAITHDGTKALALLRPSLITLIQYAPLDSGIPRYNMRMPSPSFRSQRESWVRERMQSLHSLFRYLRRI